MLLKALNFRTKKGDNVGVLKNKCIHNNYDNISSLFILLDL